MPQDQPEHDRAEQRHCKLSAKKPQPEAPVERTLRKGESETEVGHFLIEFMISAIPVPMIPSNITVPSQTQNDEKMNSKTSLMIVNLRTPGNLSRAGIPCR